jgi:hypothetical protein
MGDFAFARRGAFLLMEVQQIGDETMDPKNTEQGAGAPTQIEPVNELIDSLGQLLERQAPISEAVELLNVSVANNPELVNSIDKMLDRVPEAKIWLKSLVGALSVKGDESIDEFIKDNRLQ